MNKVMNNNMAPKGQKYAAPKAFDEAILKHHTMDDLALARDVLQLFLRQLERLEKSNWSELEVPMEMHTLKGAASAVGALRLALLAANWKSARAELETDFRDASAEFKEVAAA